MKLRKVKRSVQPSNPETQSWENEGGRVDDSAEDECLEDPDMLCQTNRSIGSLKFKTRPLPEQHLTLRLHRLASHNQDEEEAD